MCPTLLTACENFCLWEQAKQLVKDAVEGNAAWLLCFCSCASILAVPYLFRKIKAKVFCLPSQKGAGYHLDLFWVAILMIICSFMGLPWYVAATVISIAHIDSLKMETETSAPGEQPKFLGVRYVKPNRPSLPCLPAKISWYYKWSCFEQDTGRGNSS